MITNDYSDVFLIPLSNMVSNQIWSVIEATHLYLVPIIIAILAYAAQCRAAGVDEGSPSIQCYKKVEGFIITVIVIIYFACKMSPGATPNNYSPNAISVKSITCVKNGFGIFAGVPKSDILNSPFVSGLSSSPWLVPTTWSAMLNQFSIGMTNAAIGAIPCENSSTGAKYTNIRTALNELSFYEPKNPQLKEVVKQYDLQCYRKALKNIEQKQLENGKNSTLRSKKDYSFNGSETLASYERTNKTPTGKSINHVDTATLKEFVWPNYATIGTTHKHFLTGDTVTVPCADVSNYIFDKLNYDVDNGDGVEWFNALKGLKHGSASPHYYENFLYTNIVESKDGLKNHIQNWWGLSGDFLGDIKNSYTQTEQFSEVPAYFRNMANGVGSFVSAGFESGTVHQYQLAAPLVISILKACLIIVVPLLLFLTGFKPQTLLYCTIAYFAIDFSHFFLEFGAFIDEVILAIRSVVNFKSNHNTVAVDGALTYLSQIINYSVIAVWLMFASWMGIKMGNMLEPAQSAAESGNSGASSIIGKTSSKSRGYYKKMTDNGDDDDLDIKL